MGRRWRFQTLNTRKQLKYSVKVQTKSLCGMIELFSRIGGIKRKSPEVALLLTSAQLRGDFAGEPTKGLDRLLFQLFVNLRAPIFKDLP